MPSFGFRHWVQRPSTWIVLIALLFSLVPISENGRSSYSDVVASQSNLVFFVLAPATTAAVAWEASRFRPVVAFGPGTIVRIFLHRLVGWSAVFPLGYGLAVLAQGGTQTTGSSTLTWIMLAYAFLIGVCWTTIGSALGFTFKPLIALSLSAGLGYIWYAVIPSTAPGLLRHYTGDFLACCSLDARLDVWAIVTAVCGIVGATLAIVTVCLMMWSHTRLALVGFMVSVLFVGGAIALGQRLSEFGLVQRDIADMKCRSDVCAWPEISDSSFDINSQARDSLNNIAPTAWASASRQSIRWGDFGEGHLSFSGQTTLEGVLGEFVDQVSSIQLAKSDAEICGIPAKELGVIITGEPWDPNIPLTPEAAQRRIENSVCGMGR